MMTDLNTLYQNLGKDAYAYLKQIEELLSHKLKSKGLEKFSTNSADYDIVKIKNIEIELIDFGNKIHRLFSPNGCEISGTLKVTADTYTDQSKNVYTPYVYLIDLNPIHIDFLFDEERFELGGDLEIKNIKKVQGFPY